MNIKTTLTSVKFSYFLFFISYSLFSCSVPKQISKQANKILINDPSIRSGHIGICIYEPTTGEFWYNFHADKYFIPASNTKLFTLYAGMKYLGDSIIGLRYKIIQDTVYALPSGDPTLFHTDFTNQPVADFFKTLHLPVLFSNENWKAGKYGSGWAWDDYNDSYMAERNAFPIYGNVMKTEFNNTYLSADPRHLPDSFTYNHLQLLQPKIPGASISYKFDGTLEKVIIKRMEHENNMEVFFPGKKFSFQKNIPFVTNGIKTTLEILHEQYSFVQSNPTKSTIQHLKFNSIKTQPADSLFKPMMQNSNNFFAEQTLLMASNEHLGYMSDEDMIDTLLKSDLKDILQKPRWVDGSGLSRYNLFTPQSFIYILEKMKNEFGMERLKIILPTGTEGTLKNYFKKDSNYIFAKTGTLSNNTALSGFLFTKKGKLLIFSVLANNYPGDASPVRHAIEVFLTGIRKKY